MMGLVVSEVRKLKSVTTTWVMTGIGAAVIGLSAAAFMLFTGMGMGDFTGSDAQVAVGIDQIGGWNVIVLVVGLLSMTTEFRHGTIGRTLQITPSRTRVMLGKLASGSLYAVAFFVVGLLVVGLVVLVAILTGDASLSLGSESGTAIWHGIAGLILTAWFGVAIGALVRSQVVALTAALLWVLVVEPLVGNIWGSIGRWLPFNALLAVFTSADARETAGGALDWLLEPSTGLIVFVAYVVVVSAAAIALMRTRDV